MPQLIETKKKIASIQNTRKITKAMELVAANKMRVFQQLAVASRDYTAALMSGARLTRDSLGELSFAERRAKGKRLFVVVTSDKGLCGALNQRVLRAAFESDAWKGTPPEDRLYVAVGRKSAEAARSRGIEVAARFEGLKEQMTPLDALRVVDRILSFWDDGSCREVSLVAPEYRNAFAFDVRLKTYLPMGTEEVGGEAAGLEALGKVFYEPDERRVLDAVARQAMQMRFLSAFYELKAAEYSSRMIAMHNATEAAGDIIDGLTLDYNKARQAAITQQLAEIIGAVDAMN